MSRNAQEPYDPLVTRLSERFDGPVLGKDLIELFGTSDVVQLPEIQMIRLQRLETLL